MTQQPPSARTEVRRLSERGVYDREVVDAVLDEALICFVGLVHDGHPIVVPTIHARVGGTLYLHGSPASRMLRDMRRGAEVCVSAAIIDGLVVARTPFHNSMNYRSVVLYGVPRLVEERGEKLRAFEAITEHVLPGRWRDTRPPNEKELKGTMIVAVALDEVSAKVRSGEPKDDPDDYTLPYWAGVIPVRTVFGTPVADDLLIPGVGVPPYLANYRRPTR